MHWWNLGLVQLAHPGPQEMHTSDLGSKVHPVRQLLQVFLEQSEQPGGQKLIRPVVAFKATVGINPGTLLALLLKKACCMEICFLVTLT
jgi:hypothetical protein